MDIMVYDHLHCIKDINASTQPESYNYKPDVEIQRKWVTLSSMVTKFVL